MYMFTYITYYTIWQVSKEEWANPPQYFFISFDLRLK